MNNISIQIEILSTKYLLVKGKFGIPRTVYIFQNAPFVLNQIILTKGEEGSVIQYS